MTNEFLKIEGNQIYIDASHRRTNLDKWVFVCIGDEQDLRTLRSIVLSGQDLGGVVAVADLDCRADFEYWQRAVKQERQKMKARFFGMHIGCTVLIDAEILQINAGCVFRTPGVMPDIPPMPFLYSYAPETKATTNMCAIDRCKLILRPLSSITDQEAIECASRVGICDTEMEVSRHGKYLDVCSKNTSAEMRFYFYDGYSSIFTFDGCDGQDAGRVTDWLRSRNFCLPFNGFDPVAEGWAILETENQNTK